MSVGFLEVLFPLSGAYLANANGRQVKSRFLNLKLYIFFKIEINI